MTRRHRWIVACVAVLLGLSLAALRGAQSAHQHQQKAMQIDADLKRGRLLQAQGRFLEAALYFQRAIENGAKDPALPYLLSRAVHSLDSTSLILPEQEAAVGIVRFSPDGTRLLTSAEDGAVRLWDAKTGARLAAYATRVKKLHSIAINGAGNKVLVSHGEDAVSLFEAATAKLLPLGFVPQKWAKLYLALEWSSSRESNGRFATFLGGSDEIAYLDGDGSYESVCGLEKSAPHGDLILGSRANISDVTPFDAPVVFSPSGHQVFAHVAGEQFGMFDTRSTQRLYTFEKTLQTVQCAAFSPDGERLLVATLNGSILVYDSIYGQRLQSFSLAQAWGGVRSAAFSPDGRLIAAAVNDSVQVIDAKYGSRITSFIGHTGSVTDVTWSPDGERIASASTDGTVRIWDLRAGDLLFQARPRWATSVRIATNPDTKQEVVTVYDPIENFCADARTGRKVTPCWKASPPDLKIDKAHLLARLVVDRHDQSQYVELLSSDRHEMGLLANERRAISIRHRDGDVTSFALRSDGLALVTSGRSGVLRLWDTQTGFPLVLPNGDAYEIPAHRGIVHSVQFHPDGREIASVGSDQSIAVWDARTGGLKRTIRGHNAEVKKIVYTPDGNLLLSGSHDGMLGRWMANTGELVDTFHLTGPVDDFTLNEQGDLIASISFGSGLQVRLLQTDSLDTQVRATLLRCRLGLRLQADSVVRAPIDPQSCRGLSPLFPRNPVPWTERQAASLQGLELFD